MISRNRTTDLPRFGHMRERNLSVSFGEIEPRERIHLPRCFLGRTYVEALDS
jgi:hypothetical protein